MKSLQHVFHGNHKNNWLHLVKNIFVLYLTIFHLIEILVQSWLKYFAVSSWCCVIIKKNIKKNAEQFICT